MLFRSPRASLAHRPILGVPCELVVDLQLPDADVVPSEKSISYTHPRRRFTVKERPRTEIAQLYLRTIAQLPLAVLRALFGACDPDLLESMTVNGLRPAVNPATGRPHVLYQVSVTTSRSTFDLAASCSAAVGPEGSGG